MDYDSISKSYNELYQEEQLKKLEIIKKHIKIKFTDKLLDVGCGTGISTNFFKCNSIGIDPSKKLIKKGSENLIYGKAEKLKFKDKSFDITISITAIHNFNNYKKGLREIKRVTKTKGKIIITLLKKSNKYKEIKDLIIKEIKPKIIDSEKDTIFIGKND